MLTTVPLLGSFVVSNFEKNKAERFSVRSLEGFENERGTYLVNLGDIY
jgi:hypothetical protein